MASHLACVVFCALVAQTGPAAPFPDDQASLARIRAGLRAPTLTIPAIEGSLRYRVLVEGRRLRLSIPWDPWKDTAVPPYVHPRYNEPHFEFLRMVTPEEFRAGVLYPMGPNVLPAAGGAIKSIIRAAREWKAAAIRRQIKEELRQIAESNGLPQIQ